MSNATEDERVAEIEGLFEVKGWRLRTRHEDGQWEAWFYITGVGTTLPTSVTGASRLEAAEAAWALYTQRPWLGADSAA